MMHRKDKTSMGMNFGILARVLRIELCVHQGFACESAADTLKNKPTMEGAVVRLLVVFFGIV